VNRPGKIALLAACGLVLSGCQTMRRWRAPADASSAERMKQLEKQVEVLTARLENIEYEMRFNVAANQVSLGKYQEAIKGFREVVNLSPNSVYAADSLYEIAKIYRYHLKNPSKAVEVYEELIKRYPRSEFHRTAAYEIAASLAELGKKTEALAQYQKIVSSFGRDPVVEKAWYDLGALHQEGKNHKEARAAYEKLIDLFPAGTLRPAAHYSLAKSALALSDTPTALREYEKVYQDYPNAAVAELAYFDRLVAMAAGNGDSEVLAAIGQYSIRYPNGRYRAETERLLKKLENKKPRTP